MDRRPLSLVEQEMENLISPVVPDIPGPPRAPWAQEAPGAPDVAAALVEPRRPAFYQQNPDNIGVVREFSITDIEGKFLYVLLITL